MKNVIPKTSLKSRLIMAFLITSIIPIILVSLFLYYNTSRIVRENVQETAILNLHQIRENMDIWMESYEDILWQLYTDDDIVDMIDKINHGENVAVNKNQLQRTLHGHFYTKEYIKCITVLTENGAQVFYDLITGSSTRNSWIDEMDIPVEELYRQIAQDNQTHVISTREAIEMGNGRNYLFHIGHRIIDYRDVNKQLGIVIVSIDENLLKVVCAMEEASGSSRNYIVDDRGRIVSCIEPELLTTQAIVWNDDTDKRQTAYEGFAEKTLMTEKEHFTVNFVHDKKFGLDIVSISSQEETLGKLNVQQKITVMVLVISLTILLMVISILIHTLTGSLRDVVEVIKRAGKGELEARVDLKQKMPQEVETIAVEYNMMMDRLVEAMKKEKQAGECQRNAEIAALEAQINPHFLYNTLDTINWMAIDRDEYEISNSIGALANILRYGIDNSNGIVTIRDEAEWLKKYLFLQQTRLKNTFECEVHVQPETFDKKIHKLLLQPFVENSILHGFEGVGRKHFLSVDISGEGKILKIVIFDNGKGMEEEFLRQINAGVFPPDSGKNHIGMENAVSRIHMYYNEAGKVKITSVKGEYTRVEIHVPEITEEVES